MSVFGNDFSAARRIPWFVNGRHSCVSLNVNRSRHQSWKASEDQ
jgi:hypothetical protein